MLRFPLYGKVQTAQPFCRTMETHCQSGLPARTATVEGRMVKENYIVAVLVEASCLKHFSAFFCNIYGTSKVSTREHVNRTKNLRTSFACTLRVNEHHSYFLLGRCFVLKCINFLQKTVP